MSSPFTPEVPVPHHSLVDGVSVVSVESSVNVIAIITFPVGTVKGVVPP